MLIGAEPRITPLLRGARFRIRAAASSCAIKAPERRLSRLPRSRCRTRARASLCIRCPLPSYSSNSSSHYRSCRCTRRRAASNRRSAHTMCSSRLRSATRCRCPTRPRRSAPPPAGRRCTRCCPTVPHTRCLSRRRYRSARRRHRPRAGMTPAGCSMRRACSAMRTGASAREPPLRARESVPRQEDPTLQARSGCRRRCRCTRKRWYRPALRAVLRPASLTRCSSVVTPSVRTFPLVRLRVHALTGHTVQAEAHEYASARREAERKRACMWPYPGYVELYKPRKPSHFLKFVCDSALAVCYTCNLRQTPVICSRFASNYGYGKNTQCALIYLLIATCPMRTYASFGKIHCCISTSRDHGGAISIPKAKVKMTGEPKQALMR
jgi:hypothetical protein